MAEAGRRRRHEYRPERAVSARGKKLRRRRGHLRDGDMLGGAHVASPFLFRLANLPPMREARLAHAHSFG
jgi:hypothetical protein